jgi:hypothetical protein
MNPEAKMDLVERLRKPMVKGLHHPDDDLREEAAAEIARLRARPTEKDVARFLCSWARCTDWRDFREQAREIIALFPKVQP